jgi:hypothetical protein
MPIAYNQTINSTSDVPNGSWQSLSDQLATVADDEYIVSFNSIDFERDIILQDTNKIRVSNTGLYNVQYALQFYNSGGGGSGALAHIWFKVNGVTVAETGVRQSCTANNPYQVASRDYLLTLNTNDYLQIAWSTNHTGIQLFHEDAAGIIPIVASAVLTVTQVG